MVCPNGRSLFTSALIGLTLSCATVVAEEEVPDGWYGEGSLSASNTDGNTETTDLGVRADLNKKEGDWAYGVDASVDYGETDDVETRNRWALGANVDRFINERLFAFGIATYEEDEFSGFDSRGFVGAGLGYVVIDREATSWTVRGGPGVTFEEVEDGDSETGFGALARSEFKHAFNDNVSLFNDTEITYGDVSTLVVNSIGLTASISSALAARVGYEVRYQTDPPAGFDDTDTITTVSLVYGFGK